MAPTEEKYKQLKRKLKEVLEENDRINNHLKKAKTKIGYLRREKDLLLDRLARYEMPDSSSDDSMFSSSGSDSEVTDSSAGRQAMTPGRDAKRGKGKDKPSDPQTPSRPEQLTAHPGEDGKRSAKKGSAKKPATKRAPVVTKTRRIQQIPFDADGKPILPLQIGIITVLSLGEIVWDRDTFHNERYIYPVGYASTRKYHSTVDPDAVVNYRCWVSDGGDGPRFHVAAEDAPDKGVMATTATGAWTNIIRAANAIRKKEHSNSASGPDYFGFSHPTIAAIIQDLPNADKCKNYVWQKFEVIKGRGTKRVNRAFLEDGEPASTKETPEPANVHTPLNGASETKPTFDVANRSPTASNGWDDNTSAMDEDNSNAGSVSPGAEESEDEGGDGLKGGESEDDRGRMEIDKHSQS
ncbi:hypothetical protein HK104_007602 [Borealophlyctis nickersoniae]|nr:hypothetical protein HK104_007602 [Borealophlyctis nickersoniae]